MVVITCDFKVDWKQEDIKPSSNARFYTNNDLSVRLLRYLDGCELVGEPDYEGYSPDFIYEGIHL